MKSIISAILIMCICVVANAQNTTVAVLNAGGGSSLLHPEFTLDWNIGESTVIDSYASANPFSLLPLSSYLYLTCGVLQPMDNTRLFYKHVSLQVRGG